MLASGASWLTSQLKAAAGSAVTYRRGNEAAEVTATNGRSQFESADQSGVIERWESRDFLIATEDLPFGEPRRGDVITEVLAGAETNYEVCSPRGVPEWHYGDGFRTIVRVHTTQTTKNVEFATTEDGAVLTTETLVPLVMG